MRFIWKAFATKILLSGKFLLFVTLLFDSHWQSLVVIGSHWQSYVIIGGHWIVIECSPDSHLIVIRQSMTIIHRIVIGQYSLVVIGSHMQSLVVISSHWRSLDSHRIFTRKSSDSHPIVIRLSMTISHRIVIGQSSDNHRIVIGSHWQSQVG